MRKAATAAVVMLALVGVVAGVGRTALALVQLDRSPSGIVRARTADSLFYRLANSTTAKPLPGSAREQDLSTNFTRMQDKFAAHPAATLLHVVPGTLFMILAPLQLVRRIRGRYPTVHRWSGRVLLILGLMIGGSALFFAWRAPLAGLRETAIITTVALIFLYAGLAAWRAIRHGDVQTHRRWMMRYLAAGLAISMVRLVASPLSLIQTLGVQSAFVIAMASGWIVTLGITELLLRRHPQAAGVSRIDPAGLRPSGWRETR